MLRKSLMMSTVALILISCGSSSSSDDKGLDVPELNTTDFNRSDISIPDLNTSDFNNDEISIPDLNTSDFNGGDTSIPDLNTSDSNGGDTTIPNVNTSDSNGGDTTIPDINTSDSNSGDTTIPDINTSDSNGGDTTIPDINTSDSNGGDTTIPDINTSDFNSGDTTIPDLTILKKGYLVDAPVEGVAYTCSEIEGFTTNKGEFSCVDAPVEFSIGSYNLGKLDDFTSDGIVYPQDLIEGLNRNDIDDEKVINMIRLLQSLDDDGDISEIIKIDESAADKFEQFGESVNSLGLDELVNLADKDMVDKEEAINHFIENILGSK